MFGLPDLDLYLAEPVVLKLCANLHMVVNAIIIEWNAMPQYKIKKIIRGMQKRCRATIIANGPVKILTLLIFV
jgi:hypothetical protein